MQRSIGAVRGFAKAAKAANHTPPIKIFGIPGRYAEATYVAASKVGILDKVEAELGAFKGVMEKSPDFSAYLANPAVTRGEKMTKLDELLPADKISDVTRNLLSTLSANGRLSETGKIVSAFEEILAASKGVVKTEIISAEALDKKSIAAITKAVTGMLPSGQTAQVSARVDPGIVGGLQVMIGDQFMDLSVSSRISAIATELEGADMSG